MKNLFIAALKQETEGMNFFKHIGVGKINATFNTLKLIDEFKPNLIFSHPISLKKITFNLRLLILERIHLPQKKRESPSTGN